MRPGLLCPGILEEEYAKRGHQYEESVDRIVPGKTSMEP
jgi:hypothetical protein